MTNEFYTPGGNPAQGSQLQSAPMRTEFTSIETAFGKLPTMTGNGSELVRVNSGGTALESVETGAMIAAATEKTTPVDADVLPISDSAASSVLKKLTFANLWAWIQGNGSKVTVASATTPDIFGAAGQLIDYTGTATATGFATAAKAGMYRELYCADACKFTAGANLLIEGIPSGTTITLAAGALVQVRSITTTQFKMTYSLSGSFTITGNGFTVNPTATAIYCVENGKAFLYVPTATITGTSNSVNLTLTGLPVALRPITQQVTSNLIRLMDNGVVLSTPGSMTVSNPVSGTIAFYTGMNGYFTASGTKQLYTTSFSWSMV